jgi:hypothetical protein
MSKLWAAIAPRVCLLNLQSFSALQWVSVDCGSTLLHLSQKPAWPAFRAWGGCCMGYRVGRYCIDQSAKPYLP